MSAPQLMCPWRSRRLIWARWVPVSELHPATRSPACLRDCPTDTSVRYSWTRYIEKQEGKNIDKTLFMCHFTSIIPIYFFLLFSIFSLGISFTPKEVGEHEVSVRKNGMHVANSPFKIMVGQSEIGEASRVKAFGKGLVEAHTFEMAEFFVDTRNAGKCGKHYVSTLCQKNRTNTETTHPYLLRLRLWRSSTVYRRSKQSRYQLWRCGGWDVQSDILSNWTWKLHC